MAMYLRKIINIVFEYNICRCFKGANISMHQRMDFGVIPKNTLYFNCFDHANIHVSPGERLIYISDSNHKRSYILIREIRVL